MRYVPPALQLFAITALIVLLSCTTREEEQIQSGDEQPASSTNPSTSADLPDEIRDAILSHFEELTGADPQSVSIERVQAMTWPDGCLGLADPGLCPVPSKPTPGFVVTLGAFGHLVDYHADASTVLYVGPEGARELVLGDLRRQLSETAEISPDEIKIGRVQSAVWADSCLGLRGQEMCIPPVGPRAGYKVWVTLGGKEYVFHVDTTGHHDVEKVRCIDELACSTPGASPSGPTGVP